MRRAEVKVRACRECPFRAIMGSYCSYCTKIEGRASREITAEDLKLLEKFPAWCPLEEVDE